MNHENETIDLNAALEYLDGFDDMDKDVNVRCLNELLALDAQGTALSKKLVEDVVLSMIMDKRRRPLRDAREDAPGPFDEF